MKLTFLDRLTGTLEPITAQAGDVLRCAAFLPPATETLLRARVLVTGDLVGRVLEDFHGIQVLLAVIAADTNVAALQSDLAVRPAAGVFPSLAEAHAYLGPRLDIAVTTADARGTTPAGLAATVRVERISGHATTDEFDPLTLRMGLMSVDYSATLQLSHALLVSCHARLERWRRRLAEWSHHPSHPIPSLWRASLRSAFDDDLDVSRALSLLTELQDAENVDPGAKFEAFAYADRVLALDLMAQLGRARC